ncbi:MAG: hypothetical protein J1F03_03655 [Oscillospiraceae bacterium]|nr:hypothetical protein [Oscillospiraceae bacterium]
MTGKSKKNLAGMAVSAVLALSTFTAATAISMPEGSQEWRASVGYGNVYAGQMAKDNSNTYSSFSFTSSPDTSIKVWLTTYVTINSNKGLASEKNYLNTIRLGSNIPAHKKEKR